MVEVNGAEAFPFGAPIRSCHVKDGARTGSRITFDQIENGRPDVPFAPYQLRQVLCGARPSRDGDPGQFSLIAAFDPEELASLRQQKCQSVNCVVGHRTLRGCLTWLRQCKQM